MVVPNVLLFREIAPHDSAPIGRPLPWSSQNPEQQGGHSIRILNTASASFLLASATKSISLDKISY